MRCCQFDVWPVCSVLAGDFTVSHGLNHWSRRAEVGGDGGFKLEANLCFPVCECRRRPPGAVNAKMHPR